jgi:uncharacterized repeat protein (TIGR03803 family)
VTQSADGNLYATLGQGGTDESGEIVEITTSGSLVWSYSTICTFGNSSGGCGPVQILQATDGNFYGANFSGGSELGCGTIFKIDQEANVTVLYTFPNDSKYACNPVGLMQATDGNLYGATIGSGRYGDGTLFKLTTSGDFTLLYNFNGVAGNSPGAGLMQHTNGLLYGTTELGGKSNAGAVYSVNVSLGPFVKFVLPTGKVGQTAQILGQGLTGTTAITFNGAAATSLKVVSDTFMTAVVPSGATTGPVVVTTPSGTLTSNVSFRVNQ